MYERSVSVAMGEAYTVCVVNTGSACALERTLQCVGPRGDLVVRHAGALAIDRGGGWTYSGPGELPIEGDKASSGTPRAGVGSPSSGGDPTRVVSLGTAAAMEEDDDAGLGTGGHAGLQVVGTAKGTELGRGLEAYMAWGLKLFRCTAAKPLGGGTRKYGCEWDA